MRDVPKKNYIVLTLIALGVIVLCFVFMNMYNKNNKEIYKSAVKKTARNNMIKSGYKSAVKNIIHEIKYEDLDNYLQENPDVVLYINDSSKKNTDVEERLKEIIVENSIQQYVVYIEKDDNIVEKWDLNSNSPIFIAYKDGKVSEILSQKKYTNNEIENFLLRNGVIESD